MLRFERSEQRRPRNYLARREQYRLLALVAAVGAMVVLIDLLTSGGRTDLASGSAGGSIPAAAPIRSNSPAKPGVVKFIVDRERLKAIRDNSQFRAEETDAWFYLFSLVQGQGGSLNSAPATAVTYTQLVAQPPTYRGHVVRVSGEVKRIEAVTPAENDLGIQTLYRVILKPPGRSPWPITIYCLELPAGWSLGEPRANQVDVTGYFFKNHSYAWRNGMAITPVIVADSFSVRELQVLKTVTATRPESVWKMVAVAAAIAVAAVALVLWRTAVPAPTTREIDAAQVSAALRGLAEEEL